MAISEARLRNHTCTNYMISPYRDVCCGVVNALKERKSQNVYSSQALITVNRLMRIFGEFGESKLEDQKLNYLYRFDLILDETFR